MPRIADCMTSRSPSMAGDRRTRYWKVPRFSSPVTAVPDSIGKVGSGTSLAASCLAIRRSCAVDRRRAERLRQSGLAPGPSPKAIVWTSFADSGHRLHGAWDRHHFSLPACVPCDGNDSWPRKSKASAFSHGAADPRPALHPVGRPNPSASEVDRNRQPSAMAYSASGDEANSRVDGSSAGYRSHLADSPYQRCPSPDDRADLSRVSRRRRRSPLHLHCRGSAGAGFLWSICLGIRITNLN
jgi:hypothetical protein